MRAARVLDMLLILRHRGRTTATELAALLEVSERTVLRDVEVLSEAGVPVFASRGRGGGIELLDTFRTRLTDLTAQEAAALLLAGQPTVAHRLGLAAPARTVRHKLLGALPDSVADAAEHLDSWFLHDPDPPDGHRVPHGELRRLADCIERRRVVELIGPSGPPAEARPLGLVLKAGTWHLVGLDGTGHEPAIVVTPLDGLRATRITRETFTRPDGFDLSAFWQEHLAAGGTRDET
ncbi:MAG: HTH domain-containing protein [Actinomycetota bacterium]|nr:HTH domain-containing protein [Actinomycetota bacterium]